jgi:hypothetical protein
MVTILVILDSNYFNVPYYELTYLLTYSMEQSSSCETYWFLDCQEISRILWNPKVHYLIQSALQVRGSYKQFVTG